MTALQLYVGVVAFCLLTVGGTFAAVVVSALCRRNPFAVRPETQAARERFHERAWGE